MKLERLLGILTVLMQTDSVTAPELAKKFEVNRRTIGRDIDALCMAGIPVITRQGNGGGISVADGYRLDKSILTIDELSGIIAALKGIGSVSERAGVERILDKLHLTGGSGIVSLREPIIIDLASHHKSNLTEKIAMIKRAILERRLIDFEYTYEKGDSRRTIEPYFVIFFWGSWYVFGYCSDRNDWRMFKLMRMHGVQTSDEVYTPREIPEERLDFANTFIDDKKLKALFDPSVKYQLMETYGADCYKETDEGLLVEIDFANPKFIVQWLLGFGKNVKVLEPEDIAESIQAEAKKILERYK